MNAWYRPADVAFEILDDAVFVLDLRDMNAGLSPQALQGAAGTIWLALGTSDAPIAESDIIRGVAQVYGMEPADITEQAAAFLDELKSAGLALMLSVNSEERSQ